MVTSSRSPSENGSIISNESGKPSPGRRSPQNVMAQQKVTKEEARKRNGEKPAKHHPQAHPTHLCTQACTRSHPPVCFYPQFFFLLHPTKARSQLPTYLLGISLPLSLNCSAPCSYGIMQGLKKLCRMNWCLPRDSSNSGVHWHFYHQVC